MLRTSPRSRTNSQRRYALNGVRRTNADRVPLRAATMAHWPHIANAPLGIMEFTVFGKAVEGAKP